MIAGLQRGRDELDVVLVDDHAIVREGLSMLLAAHDGICVAGEAGDRASALETVERTRPQIVLLDVSLGDEDGIPLISTLLERHPAVRVIVVTMHRDRETVRQALLAGASGFYVKGGRSSELIDAIFAVARGERYLHTSVTASVVDDSMRWLAHGESLSARERAILGRYAAGQSANDIGSALGITPYTVRRHLANVGEKLGIRGRAALTRYAIENGLLREQEAGVAGRGGEVAAVAS